MTYSLFATPLLELFYLFEARDEFLITTFGEKLVNKVKSEIDNNMAVPADLTQQLQAAGDTPPANHIVQWFISKDPIQGKAVQWLIVQYLRGNFQLEDIERVQGLVTEFMRVRAQLAVKDLGQYKTVEALETAVTPHQDKEVLSKRQAQKQEVIDPAMLAQMNVIAQTPSVFIATTKTKEASIYVGSADFFGRLNNFKDTKWCTAATKTTNYFDHYSRQGPLIVVIVRTGPDAGKYQFHFESSQFKDAADIEIRNLRSWLSRNPEVKQALAPMASKHGKLQFMSDEDIARAKQEKIASGIIKQIVDTDKYQLLWVNADDETGAHAIIMGDDRSNRSSLKYHSAPTINKYSHGIMYFVHKQSGDVATHRLGMKSVKVGDQKAYPLIAILRKDPVLAKAYKRLSSHDPDVEQPQTDTAEGGDVVDELVAAKEAVQVLDTPQLAAWWIKSIDSYARYFEMPRKAAEIMYQQSAEYPDAGIMLFDTGSDMFSYRCGDMHVQEVDVDKYHQSIDNKYYSRHSTSGVLDFINRHPASKPLLEKYADRYGFFPLMTDKGKDKFLKLYEEEGAITTVHDNPRVLKINTPKAFDIMKSLIHVPGRTPGTIPKGFERELSLGNVYIVDSSKVFIPRVGLMLSVDGGSTTSSNNSLIETFKRYPQLKTVFADEINNNGIVALSPELKDTVPALAREKHITPIAPSPLFVKLNDVTGLRWFIEHHTKPRQDGSLYTVDWHATNGVMSPTQEKLQSAVSGKGTLVNMFGTVLKKGAPLVILLLKTSSGEHEIRLMTFRSNTDSRVADHVSSVAYLQKFPDIVKHLVPQLTGVADEWATVLRTIAGGPETAASDAEGTGHYNKALAAVSSMLGSTKTYVGRSVAEQQSVSDLNIDKFTHAAKQAAATLKSTGKEFTDEQAVAVAKHIHSVIQFVSNRSYRTIPPELAEWLKYATNVSKETKTNIAKQFPAFSAGVPLSVDDAIAVYQTNNDYNIEALRAYMKLAPEDERSLDRRLVASNRYLGVNYENIEQESLTRVSDRRKVEMRNLPLSFQKGVVNSRGKRGLESIKFPSEEFLLWCIEYHPTYVTNTTVPSERRTPKVRAAIKFFKKNNTLRGFTYTPPVERPLHQGRTTPARPAPAAAPRQAAPGAVPGQWATKAEHARHIITNRTDADTRQTLIRKLIDEVGLTPAGAATYYYNLTRARPVAEGEEEIGILRSTLRLLGQHRVGA